MKQIHIITPDFTHNGLELLLRQQQAELGRYVEIMLNGQVWTVECVSHQFDYWMITRGEMEEIFHQRHMWIRSIDDPSWDFPYVASFDHLYYIEDGFKNVVMKLDELVTCIRSYAN